MFLLEGLRVMADASARITGRQRLVLFLLLGAGFMLSVDFSILNVALPQVGAGVGLGLSALPWVVTAYALPAAGFTLLFGRIADLFGRRRMFLTGMALLAAASIIGGLATNPAMLLTGRTLQGFATAIAAPAGLALLITSFSDEKQRARVLGLNGAVLSGGFTVGALAGGTLVGILSWRWAFLVNVPLAVLIVVVTPFLVRASGAAKDVALDIPGAVTVTLGLLGFSYGVINRNLYVLAGGLALLVVFWLIERKARAPLAAVSILSRPSVKWGNLGGLVMFTMEAGLVYLMTLYMQDVLHFAPLTTGLLFGVPGLAAVTAGVIAGRFVAKYGSRKVLAVGLLMQSGFTATLIPVGTGTGWLAVLIPSLFIGFFGHVTSIVAYMVTATSGLPDSEQGLASGLAALTQQIGIAVGVPILGTVAAIQASLLSGIRLSLAIDVVVTVATIALVWNGLRPRPDVVAVDPASDAGGQDEGEIAA
jgi:MFS family permease